VSQTKTIVLYHDNCADGFGAAYAAHEKLGDDSVEYQPIQYKHWEYDAKSKTLLIDSFIGTKIPLHLRDVDLHILDFSLSREVTQDLMTCVNSLTWLDHHNTAFEWWLGDLAPNYATANGFRYLNSEGDVYIELDSTQSGARLAWNYYHENKVLPTLLRYLDDHDRWKFQLEYTKPVQAALWSYAPWTFDLFDSVRSLVERIPSDNEETLDTFFYEEGKAIIRNNERLIKAHVNNSVTIRATPDAPLGLASNCPWYLASEVGHRLAERSGTYGVAWHVNNHNVVKMDFRSNGYDVSALARELGGGGHVRAAGTEIPLTKFVSLLS
jgi:oligoribonuclease NrnB/cAMP/cGMP phosphodiesterase (DHH superfamily)